MTFDQKERQQVITEAVDTMDPEHLRWMVKTLLSIPGYQEMDKPLESLEGFLNQTEADYLFQETVLDTKKRIDSSYLPYRSYYKDRLVELMHKAAEAIGRVEEGQIFETVASEYETAFLMFWDGQVHPEEMDIKKQRVVNVAGEIVHRAVKMLGVDYFSQSQKSILSSVLGVVNLHVFV